MLFMLHSYIMILIVRCYSVVVRVQERQNSSLVPTQPG
jgi:hypothetical protein